MLVGRHSQSHQRPLIDVDNHPLDHRDHRVSRQWVLPGLEIQMPDPRVGQVHLADAALILLEGGDLRRVGRPRNDGAVALPPTGVVGGVAVIEHPVSGQRPLLPGRDLAHPEVVIADERCARSVGRQHLVSNPSGAAAGSTTTAASTSTSSAGRRCPGTRSNALVAIDVTRDQTPRLVPPSISVTRC